MGVRLGKPQASKRVGVWRLDGALGVCLALKRISPSVSEFCQILVT